MSDKDDEVDDDLFEMELYDTSDVTFDIKTRSRREIALVAKAATSDFNLVKYYLSLKEYVEKIEAELNISERDDEKH